MRPKPPFDSEWCAGVWKGPQVTVARADAAGMGRNLEQHDSLVKALESDLLTCLKTNYPTWFAAAWTSTPGCSFHFLRVRVARALCDAVLVLSACADKGQFCKKCGP